MTTTLADMGHLKPPTPVATNNTAAKSIVNRTAKKKISSNRHEVLLGQGQNTTKQFPHILGRGKEKLADYVTKHHTIWYHRATRPSFVKATKKDIENSKDRQNGTRRGCAGTNNSNPGETRKPDNPLKGIMNTIPQEPNNPLKESGI